MTESKLVGHEELSLEERRFLQNEKYKSEDLKLKREELKDKRKIKNLLLSPLALGILAAVVDRRVGREVLDVDPVHRREVARVLEPDVGLDDVGERAAGGGPDAAQVLERAAGLCLDAAA